MSGGESRALETMVRKLDFIPAEVKGIKVKGLPSRSFICVLGGEWDEVGKWRWTYKGG